MILKDLIKLLKKGEKVICPACKKGTIIPLNANEEIDNYDDLYFFKCTYCDYFIERIPPITIE